MFPDGRCIVPFQFQEMRLLFHIVEQQHNLFWCFLNSQEPGRAEADFGRLDVKSVIRNIYILFSRSEIPVARDDQEIMDMVDPSTALPPWFTEEDLAVYASLYEKSGFCFPLQVPYRYIENAELHLINALT